MLSEFNKFAFKGNIVDLAVGVIIGGAFGKIASSLVTDIIMPLIGIMMGGVNFKELRTTVPSISQSSEAVTLNYGMFIQSIVDFMFIALSVFIFVKFITYARENAFKKQAKEEKLTKQEELLCEIRDLLKNQSHKT